MLQKTVPAAALLLAGFIALAPQQAAATTWSGSQLSISGGSTNGCRIGVINATHTGNTLNNIFVNLVNRGTRPARITMNVELSGNNARKSGSVSSGILPPGGTQTPVQAFPPYGGSLDGTVLRVTITSCTQS